MNLSAKFATFQPNWTSYSPTKHAHNKIRDAPTLQGDFTHQTNGMWQKPSLVFFYFQKSEKVLPSQLNRTEYVETYS